MGRAGLALSVSLLSPESSHFIAVAKKNQNFWGIPWIPRQCRISAVRDVPPAWGMWSYEYEHEENRDLDSLDFYFFIIIFYYFKKEISITATVN